MGILNATHTHNYLITAQEIPNLYTAMYSE